MDFFRRKSPAEILREHKRSLDRAVRELDRERAKLEQQEKKIIQDIKKSAKLNQTQACKIMANDLVRTRNYVQKFIQMRAELQGVGLRLQTMKSSESMTNAMLGVSKAMKSMNRNVKLPQMQKIMMEFEKQSDMMEMKQEMMEETIDDTLGQEGDEEESEAIVNQIFDEIGITLGQQMHVGTALPAQNTEDDDLMQRLEKLKSDK